MTLARFGTKHQVIAPPAIIRQSKVEHFKAFNRSFVAPSNIYVCSVQTLVNRAEVLKNPPDIIIIDESHHLTVGSTWAKIIDQFPSAKLLPVTATPCRMDGKGLGKNEGGFADDIILGPSMGWLIKNGYLSDYALLSPPNELDLKGIRTVKGDYDKKELQSRIDKPSIIGDTVTHYKQHANGKRAIAFCVSVEHSQHVADKFNDAEIPAAVLDGTLDAGERDRRIKAFESGELLVLASCDVVSEGFDLPAIEVAILLRPTKSLALFLQQVGRALRAVYAPGYELSTPEGRLAAISAGPKPIAQIFDHVGNIGKMLGGKFLINHGFPDQDRIWTLEGLKKSGRKKKDDDDDLPDVHIQTCPKCFAIHKPALECPVCHYVYPVQGRMLDEHDGQLISVSTEAREEALRAAEIARAEADLARREKYERLKREKQCKTLEDWIALGRERGYKFADAWAKHRFESRQAKQSQRSAAMDF